MVGYPQELSFSHPPRLARFGLLGTPGFHRSPGLAALGEPRFPGSPRLFTSREPNSMFIGVVVGEILARLGHQYILCFG